MSESFPACFFCCINFNLSHNSLGLDGKITVEIPEALIAGDSSDLITVLSPGLLRLFYSILYFISFPDS